MEYPRPIGIATTKGQTKHMTPLLALQQGLPLASLLGETNASPTWGKAATHAQRNSGPPLTAPSSSRRLEAAVRCSGLFEMVSGAFRQL
eukprot:3038922-Alexandrium_andersonii.AAC.1